MRRRIKLVCVDFDIIEIKVPRVNLHIVRIRPGKLHPEANAMDIFYQKNSDRIVSQSK